jgi:7-keto-8-aminopelargonate synthetase-like enzyme
LRGNERINLSRLQTRLFEKGLAVEYVRHYSSTPPGGAIRIAIFATHSQEQIDRLLEEIGKFV